jgi:hypothetical protein
MAERGLLRISVDNLSLPCETHRDQPDRPQQAGWLYWLSGCIEGLVIDVDAKSEAPPFAADMLELKGQPGFIDRASRPPDQSSPKSVHAYLKGGRLGLAEANCPKPRYSGQLTHELETPEVMEAEGPDWGMEGKR